MSAGNPLQNAKHEAVLQAYIADRQRVGFKAYLSVYPQSSDAAAKTGFSRLLKNADFAARLQHLDAEITARVVDDSVMSAREVLQELSKLGRSSIKHIVSVGGDTTDELVESLQDLPDEHAATVKSFTVERYVEGAGDDVREVKRIKFELHDKRGALRDLGQHHKLFTEKHEHTGKDEGPIQVEDKTDMSELEVARRIAFALERGARAGAAGAKAVKVVTKSKAVRK
ncbi:phage terminase small subunit [Bradyrhizobium sp. i1.4.4]